VATTRLQDRLKKKRPFDSAREEAILSLVRASDQLQIRVCRLLRPFGLTPSQYNVLRILRGENRPLPILEVADRTVTVVPGITGVIDRLEEAGLVKRGRCDKDRRVVYVAITQPALDLLARVDEPLRHLQDSIMSSLAPRELDTLIELLQKVRAPLEAGE
jgi:DNA-binding MarR family transcriptional regulator